MLGGDLSQVENRTIIMEIGARGAFKARAKGGFDKNHGYGPCCRGTEERNKGEDEEEDDKQSDGDDEAQERGTGRSR